MTDTTLQTFTVVQGAAATAGRRLPLKFLHITKTAGSSIEEAGLRAGFQWGIHDKDDAGKNRFGWHSILRIIPLAYVNQHDWFMVVRNPYDRILSEYNCNYMGVQERQTVQQMNAQLINNIKSRYVEGDHFTEQYKYLPPGPHMTSKLHVLKFENLATEFRALMDLYNLPHVTLDNIHNNKGTRINTFTTQDFSSALLTLINQVYYLDFIQFNYPITQPKQKKPSLVLQFN
jgi:hypothetical protein